MPSPRAVLADIHDLKLDPTKAHRHTKASGRLSHVVTGERPATPSEVAVDQPELKTIESNVAVPVVVEATVAEQSQDVVKPIEQPIDQVDDLQKKPPTKKVTKKDKAEDPPPAAG